MFDLMFNKAISGVVAGKFRFMISQSPSPSQSISMEAFHNHKLMNRIFISSPTLSIALRKQSSPNRNSSLPSKRIDSCDICWEVKWYRIQSQTLQSLSAIDTQNLIIISLIQWINNWMNKISLCILNIFSHPRQNGKPIILLLFCGSFRHSFSHQFEFEKIILYLFRTQ